MSVLNVFAIGACPICGDDVMGMSLPDGTWNDGGTLICADLCGFRGFVSCEDGEAHMAWNDDDIMGKEEKTAGGEHEDR